MVLRMGHHTLPARTAAMAVVTAVVTAVFAPMAPPAMAGVAAYGTVAEGTLVNERRPAVEGVCRYGHRLVADAGAWSPEPDGAKERDLRGARRACRAPSRAGKLGRSRGKEAECDARGGAAIDPRSRGAGAGRGPRS